MSEGEGPQQKALEWFQQHSKEGKPNFYMKDVVKAHADVFDKRDIQKAIQDCAEAGTLMYFSTGSTTSRELPQECHVSSNKEGRSSRIRMRARAQSALAC